MGVYINDGSAFSPAIDTVESATDGVLGGAESTSSNQTGIGTTITDITGTSVTVDVPDGHRIRISGHVFFQQQTNSGFLTLSVREGSTENGFLARSPVLPSGGTWRGDGHITLVPTAGTHTYKLSARTSANTVNILNATEISSIIVEDLGPDPFV